MTGKLISRYCQQYRVHVEDYRLLFATPEQRKVVLRQIEKRSRAAKAGWVKRRQALVAAAFGRDAEQARGDSPAERPPKRGNA